MGRLGKAGQTNLELETTGFVGSFRRKEEDKEEEQVENPEDQVNKLQDERKGTKLEQPEAQSEHGLK